MRSQAFRKLREELKLTADLIHAKKPLLKKAAKRGLEKYKNKYCPLYYDPNYQLIEKQLYRLRFEYRHKHIVASLLRGKTREQIEPKRHKPCESKYHTCSLTYGCSCNKPSETYIESLLLYYGQEGAVDETLRVSTI